MDKFEKNGISPWLLLGGLALAGNILNKKEQRVVHVHTNEVDESEFRKLAKEQELLEKKEKIEKNKVPNSIENIKERVDNDSNVGLFGLGSCWCIFVGIGCLMAAFEGSLEWLLGALFFLIIGIILLKKCIKSKKNKDIYMQYISLIIIQGERSIVQIANQMNKTYEQATKDIITIISKNYIKDFHINKKEKMIVSDISASQKSKTYDGSTIHVDKYDKCHACGGNLISVFDGIKYCKYCGTKIN